MEDRPWKQNGNEYGLLCGGKPNHPWWGPVGSSPQGAQGLFGPSGGISLDTLSHRTQVCSEESPVHEEAPDREAGGDPVGTCSLDSVCPQKELAHFLRNCHIAVIGEEKLNSLSFTGLGFIGWRSIN